MNAENTATSSKEKKAIWFLAGAFTVALLFSSLPIIFDRNEPLIFAEDVRAGEFVEVLLPASVHKGSKQYDSRLTAHRLLERFVEKGQSYAHITDVVLTGNVQYTLDNGKAITFFDEAYVTWLLQKDLLTIVIKTNEFQDTPQGNRYRVFVRIPERGFTQDFHRALNRILEQIGSSTIETKEAWSL